MLDIDLFLRNLVAIKQSTFINPLINSKQLLMLYHIHKPKKLTLNDFLNDINQGCDMHKLAQIYFKAQLFQSSFPSLKGVPSCDLAGRRPRQTRHRFSPAGTEVFHKIEGIGSVNK